MFLAGLEPATFRVLGGCDNHYTTETLRSTLAPARYRLNIDMFGVKTTVCVKTGPRRCI